MIREKVTKLLESKDPEAKILGYRLLQEEEPAVWAALLCYTGIGDITAELLELLHSKDSLLNIGHIIKYKGMPNCPCMVVTEIQVLTSNTGVPASRKYYTQVTGKYFNKSNQSFIAIKDRLECFEIVNIKKENNEL